MPQASAAGYDGSVAIAKRLPFTGDDDADRLLVEEPLALLIGFALDQQVTVQKAFSGPAELKRRIGHLDARRIADLDPADLDSTFRERPALHRFPGSMAGRVQALCRTIADEYHNDAAAVWNGAADGTELEARILALPGIGPMKAGAIIAILGKQLGVQPPGWEIVTPKHPTLGDVTTAAELGSYQASKRAHKASLKAGD